jgi:hypothetical protein
LIDLGYGTHLMAAELGLARAPTNEPLHLHYFGFGG